MIRRRIPLKRSTKPIRARRGAPRRGPAGIPPDQWRNAPYRQFLREHGRCMVPGCRRAGCDPAHGPVNGTSSKGPDAEAGPLCREHHDEQHSMIWPQFEERYGFDRAREAKVWWVAFQSWKEQ